MTVKAKKHLGQHFLIDKNVSKRIAEQFQAHRGCTKVLEIGPGMGALTTFLLENKNHQVWAMDVDSESIVYLNENFPALKGRIIEADFLKDNLALHFGTEPFAVVGNFPYNISSQILFHCLDHKEVVESVVGMFQKEVAERLAAKHGNKTYGIISVLLQTYYDIEYLFTVHEHVFSPPPKVKSAVIRMTRKSNVELPVPYAVLRNVVKTGFNQRRKTLRNALKPIIAGREFQHPFLDLRAEQLSIQDFADLSVCLQNL